uniref:DNA-directed RNA polymerase n=1 Tax=Termitomyces sp. T123 TaxID=2846913 RepID=A0A8F1AD52_9AGAR|nr:RNA polymerase [Termitomyces sp. T123]
MYLAKYNTIPTSSIKNYSILTNFSVFNKIEDKEIYTKLLLIKEQIEKNVFSKISDDYEKILNKYKGTSFKTNYKNIFIANEYLRNIGIERLSSLALTLGGEQGLILAPESILNNQLLETIKKLYAIGYMQLVIVGEFHNYSNYNFEYEIMIEKNVYFTVKAIELKDLIAITRHSLYGEKIEEDPDFKKYINSWAEDKKKLEILLSKEPKYKIRNAMYVFHRHLGLNEWINKDKNFYKINNLYKRSMFIFQGMNWNDVVLNYRQNGITISSGMNNKKGLVNILEFKLSLSLYSFFREYNFKFIYELITNSSENLKDEYYKTKLESKNENLAPFSYKDIKPTLTYYRYLKEIDLDTELQNSEDIADKNSDNPVESSNNSHKNQGENANLPFKGAKGYHTLIQNKFIRRYSTRAKNFNDDNNKLYHINKLYKNEFLIKLSEIINDKKTSKEERQIRIENIWKEMESTGQKDLESIYLKSNKYLIKAKETLNLKFQDKTLKRKFPNYFELLNSVKLLMITFSITLTHITRKTNGWNNVIANIGEKLFFQMYTDKISKGKNMGNTITNFQEMFYNYSFEKFLIELSVHNNFKFFCLRLGDFFLEILCSEPHIMFKRSLVDEETFQDKEGMYIVTISSIFKDEVLNNIYIDPASLPMLCTPKEWTNDINGGNLINFYKNNVITGKNSHGHEMKNKEILYKTINYLSKIEFKINNDLLKFLFSEKGNFLIHSVIESKEKEISLSEKIQFYTNLFLAEVFSKETFYLPLKADFRGRLYVTSFYLNYQGSEIAKSLVYFNKGEPLTKKGLEKLYIYGCNLYNPSNLNKENHEERINWITKNLSNIYEMDIKFLSQAENIWLFTSFCLILKKLKENPSLLVHFPIFIDATCSGIQHIAGMIKDTDLGLNVNLTKQGKEDKVQDIYTKLLTAINYAIFLEGNNLNSKFPKLKHVKLTRSEVKTPIMTKTYNVSLIGIKNQLMISIKDRERKTEINIIEKEKEKDKLVNKCKKFEDIKIKINSYINNNPIYLDYKDIFKLAEIVESCIFSNFPKLKLVYDFFKDICKIFNKLGIPILWVTPSGLIITQNYYKTIDTKIAISYAGVTKKIVIKEWIKDLDKKAQINAVIPNIVHSLDASHLMQVIKTCEDLNIDNILPIHDCFGCHPNNLEIVFKIIKMEFINIYSQEEFLTKYQNYVENHLKVIGFEVKELKGKKWVIYRNNSKLELPVAPKIGTLNLNEVLDSQYMFN